MQKTFTDNKRVAKNTILLYLRQLFSLLLSLFTVRIILNTLGVDDYGIYNVVGGVVGMITFLTSSLTAASQRFLAFDLAKGDDVQTNRTFCMIAISYYIIGIIVVFLLEGVAVWFLNNKMVIPEDRLYAANWVLQFAILQFALGLTCAPYMADVVAHEKLDIFAYVGIINVSLRLLLLYFVVISPFDKLITISAIYFLIEMSVRFYYQWYCKKHFKEAQVHIIWDKKRIGELLSYSGWSVFGTLANICRGNGINVLLNLFFSPAINAAYAIAYQINGAISSFVQNFYTAVDPQIIKNYAVKELQQMYKLIFFSSRLAFFLLLLLCIPIILNVDQILVLWLKNPPEYASVFVKIVLFNTLLETFSHPLSMGISATGNIRNYQIVVSGTYIMIFPIVYCILKLGAPPEAALIVNTVIVVLCLIPRLLFCKRQYGLPSGQYLKNVVLQPTIVGFLGFGVSLLFSRFINIENSIINLIASIVLSLFATGSLIFSFGLRNDERQQVYKFIKKRNNEQYFNS